MLRGMLTAVLAGGEGKMTSSSICATAGEAAGLKRIILRGKRQWREEGILPLLTRRSRGKEHSRSAGAEILLKESLVFRHGGVSHVSPANTSAWDLRTFSWTAKASLASLRTAPAVREATLPIVYPAQHRG